MGDHNQYVLIEKLHERLDGPTLEVGSRDYGSTQIFRPLLATQGEYVGVDMSAGKNVDLVLDLTQAWEEVDRALEGRRFGTILCLSVLEHCAQPFVMAENLTRLLKPGGQICLSVPFAWQFHGYPSDYWRFTHEGVRKLFPQLAFDLSMSGWTTSQDGSFTPLSNELGQITLGTKGYLRQRRPGSAITAAVLRGLGKLPVLRRFLGFPYVLAPTMVFMVGRRSRSESESRAA